MHIDIGEIRKSPGFKGHYDMEWSVESIEISGDKAVFEKPLQVSLDIRNNNGIIELSGSITGGTKLICVRCLEQYSFQLDANIEERYCHSSEVARLQDDGINTEEINVFEGNRIELDEIFQESLVLAFPMKNLCKEDCAGLCSNCGTNLNTDQCSCETVTIDPRLEVLKKLLKN